MFGLTNLSLVALLLSPVALADSHMKHKKRHEVREASVEKFSGVARNMNETEHSLSKRAFTGRGTFYYTGLGACGQWSKDTDYMVALNSAQYGSGYPGPQCFKYITIQSNGVTISGVEILDECPTCPYGALDLSPSLFQQFHSANGGTLDLTWWFDGDGPAPSPSPSPSPSPTPTTTWQAPSPTWSPEPAPTSTWSPPPPPPPPSSTSTWVAPTTTSTSTWVAPSTTSTSTWVAPSSSSAPASSVVHSSSSSSSSSSSAFISSSTIISSAAASNTTNPFAIISTDRNATSTSVSLSPSASSSAGLPDGDVQKTVQQASIGNLAAINGLVASYGQLIVVGAGGYQA